MTLDRTSTRNDITFLRRRPKRTADNSATQTPAPTKISFDRNRKSSSSSTPQGNTSLRLPSAAPSNPSQGLSLGGGAASQAPTRTQAATSPKLSFDRPRNDSMPSSAAGKPASTPNSPSTGLSLSLKPDAATVERPKMDAELPKHNVPYFRDNMEMSLDANPVVRLDFRQSGIGSLIIDGAQAFAWETQKKIGGLQVKGGNGSSAVTPPSFGRRQLVEFSNNLIIVGLRHSAHLRRLVVASSSDNLRLKLHDGSEIFMPTEQGKNVMLISRIGHEFEIRMEQINTVDIMNAFSIKESYVA